MVEDVRVVTVVHNESVVLSFEEELNSAQVALGALSGKEKGIFSFDGIFVLLINKVLGKLVNLRHVWILQTFLIHVLLRVS